MTKGMMEAPYCFQIFQGSTSAMLGFFWIELSWMYIQWSLGPWSKRPERLIPFEVDLVGSLILKVDVLYRLYKLPTVWPLNNWLGAASLCPIYIQYHLLQEHFIPIGHSDYLDFSILFGTSVHPWSLTWFTWKFSPFNSIDSTGIHR